LKKYKTNIYIFDILFLICIAANLLFVNFDLESTY